MKLLTNLAIPYKFVSFQNFLICQTNHVANWIQNLELKVYLVNNFCLLFSKFVFRCCRGLFFQSTTDQIRHPSDPPEAQSSTTLVIHGRPNMRKMAQKPSTEPKVQKKRTRPRPPVHQIPIYHAREFWNNLKMRGRMAFNTIFPSSPWRDAWGTEGRYSQEEIISPRVDHYN